MSSIFSRLFGSDRSRARSVQSRAAYSFRPTVEGLEWREVMSSPASMAANFGPAIVAQSHQQAGQLLEITEIVLNDIVVTGANQLTATVDIVGNVLGREFTLEDIEVPITVEILDNDNGECPILHLELEIEDLNVLGLHVELNDCMEGPITVDITANEGEGLLGDLLGGLLCGDGAILPGILGQEGGLLNLADDALTDLTGVLGQVLGGTIDPDTGAAIPGLFDSLLGEGTDVGAQQHGGRRCDLVNLQVGEAGDEEGLAINLLGLNVTTSPICLDVYAQRGDGLLGNLLCGVNNLLNNPGNATNAIDRFVDRIIDRLDRLND